MNCGLPWWQGEHQCGLESGDDRANRALQRVPSNQRFNSNRFTFFKFYPFTQVCAPFTVQIGMRFAILLLLPPTAVSLSLTAAAVSTTFHNSAPFTAVYTATALAVKVNYMASHPNLHSKRCRPAFTRSISS